MEEKIIWQDYEHHHVEKSQDWYWSFGIVAFAIIIVSVIFSNWLFALLVLIAGFSVILQANKKPRLFNFELNKKGLVIGKNLYTYDNLDAFYVSEEEHDRKLIFRSKKIIVPLIVVPIVNVDRQRIETFLADKVHKEELHEPAFQKVAEYFGF